MTRDYRTLYLEALVELVMEAGFEDADGLVDSCAKSSIAEAMIELACEGRMKIKSQHGRRILGEWVPVVVEQASDPLDLHAPENIKAKCRAANCDEECWPHRYYCKRHRDLPLPT